MSEEATCTMKLPFVAATEEQIDPMLSEEVNAILNEPLDTTWNWFVHVDGVDYFKSMILLGSFDTMRSFFCYKNNIPAPHQIFDGKHACLISQDEEKQFANAFSIFKDGCTPEWEHASNIEGGSLMCRQFLSAQSLEYVWDRMCIWMIQASSIQVNGIRVVQKFDRRTGLFHKLEVWLRTTDPAVIAEVEAHMHAVDCSLAPHFMPHKADKIDRCFVSKSNAFRRRQPRLI